MKHAIESLSKIKIHAIVTVLLLAYPFVGISSGAEPVAVSVDQVPVAVVDPMLDSDFFRAKGASYPEHIIEHKDGHLENTQGGKITKEDSTKIEHTSKCFSSHQGKHLMPFSKAQQFDGGFLLEVTGGFPAYTSSLSLQIGKDKSLNSVFEGTYPMSASGEKITWNVTKQVFKMKSDNFTAGERLFGWLSVEFEEIQTVDRKVTRKNYKIEGYVKPVISKSD